MIVIGAILQNAGPQPQKPAPAPSPATAPEAETIWQPESVTAEPKLQAEPAVKVTPMPPLPQEKFKFRSLPPRDEDEAPTFAPLPKLQEAKPDDQSGIKIRELPLLPPASRVVTIPKSQVKEPVIEAPAFTPLPRLQNVIPDDQGGIQIRKLPALPPAIIAAANPESQKKEPVIDLGQLIHMPAVKPTVVPVAKPVVKPVVKPAIANAVNLDFAAPAVEQSPADGKIKIPTESSRTLDGTVVERLPKPAQNLYVQNERQSQTSELHQSLASADLEVSQFGFAEPLVQTGDFKIQLVSAELPADAPAKKKKKKVVVSAKKSGDSKSASAKSAKSAKSDKDSFKLAAQPVIGDHYIEDNPQTDARANLIEPLVSDFSADAINPYLPYEPFPQINVYEGKTLYANQRPLVELGRPWYQLGQLSPGSSVLGYHNNVTPQFLIYGDARTAYASNDQGSNTTSQIASQLNLDFDLKLTGTERFHAFFQPTSSGGRNTRRLLDDDETIYEGNANPVFGYFEGDLGALAGGAIGKTLPFDLPFTLGLIPLVFQNGVWFEDAILGVAATLPARNSPRFNISNMDITFFAGYDQLDSPAFEGDDSAARIIGMASFLEALNGYIEIDYAFLDDRTFDDRSYHNIGIGYTRRYGRFLSNSTRVIVNAGQNAAANGENTADGVLLLSENSLITGAPSNVVPYFNMFAGFDRPQSAARAGTAGGVLRNTGILFESDNLTGYPTLDATANDTYGMALGVNILSGGDRFSQQLVLETAFLGVAGDDATRNANGDQYGVGFRYQLPLSNSVIFRSDGMVGFLRNDDDISGIRVEVRKKF